MTITEFLEARITEDEAVARAASGSTVEGRIGAWSAVPGGDEWEVGDEDFEVEILVALRPNLKRPPTPLDGKWGAITVWSDLEPGSDRNYVIPRARHIARQDPARVLAECAAKRAIVEQHKDWPVLVAKKPEFIEDATDIQSMAMRVSQEMEWLTEREYVKRFGTEAPTTNMVKALAAVYASHPDYREEWAQ